MMKIVFLGSKGSGKSTLIKKIDGSTNYKQKEKSTEGIEIFINKTIKVDNKDYNLHLWNLSSLEKYKLLTNIQYKNARGIVLLFDWTNLESFKYSKIYLNEIKKNLPDIPILYVGNKKDLIQKTIIKKEKINEIVNKYKNLIYKEISAHTWEDTDSLIIDLLNKILNINNIEEKQIVENIRQNYYNKNTKKKKNCCC